MTKDSNLTTKLGHYFWNSMDAKTLFSFLIAGHCNFKPAHSQSNTKSRDVNFQKDYKERDRIYAQLNYRNQLTSLFPYYWISFIGQQF